MSRLATRPDVCLLLEGTYPYVSGGVSTWVHQIITALPEIRFSLFYIGSEKSAHSSYRYQLPPNVVGVDELYLHEPARPGRRTPAAPAARCAAIHTLVRQLILDPASHGGERDLLFAIAREVMKLAPTVSLDSFWRDPGTWDLISEFYDHFAPGESFLDFYWSLRALAEPVWRIMAALGRVPAAPLYHSLCTGYAGFVAGAAALHYESVSLLSEHGIYVRERVAELHKARWIHDPPVQHPGLSRSPALLRQLWMDFFELLGRFAYQTAHRVTSLFGRNAALQTGFGAAPATIEIIPNGIHVPDFYGLRGRRKAARQLQPARRNVGFIGRIVRIKDVKTLLKAARRTIDLVPDARFLIAGPTDEEPDYAAECDGLRLQLGLQDHVTFLGPQNREDVLPDMDIMLLTSVSEGLPFVILEAFAAGIPCVSTDVGACRELIEGRPGESPAHGAAGLIAPVGDANAIAAALVRLLTDPALAATMGDAGRARAESAYSRDAVVNRYRELYQHTTRDFARAGRTTTRIHLPAAR